MAFMLLEDGIPDFKKAVISVWFRVPQESLDKAREDYAAHRDDDNGPPPMCGIVPIMMFGPRNNKLVGFEQYDTGVPASEEVALYYWVNQPTCAYEMYPDYPKTETTHLADYRTKEILPPVMQDPSYIGIDCRSKKNVLSYNFWYGSNGGGDVGAETKPEITNTFKVATSFSADPSPVEIYDVAYPVGPPDQQCGNIPPHYHLEPPEGYGDFLYPWFTETFITDYGNDVSKIIQGGVPEHIAAMPYGVGGGTVSEDADYEAGVEVKGDQWHHLLMSIESKPISTKGLKGDYGGAQDTYPKYGGVLTSGAEIFIALDDKNLTGKKLSYFVNGDTAETNTVLTANGYYVFTYVLDEYFMSGNGDSGRGYMIDSQKTGYDVATYDFDPPAFPIGQVWFPGDETSTKRIQLAEFMLFTDVTLDTSKVENRRLFIGEPDKNGFQHPANFSPITIPFNKEAIGDPATWEPGADWPAYAPGLFDPSSVPSYTRIKPGEKPVIADIDFTKCAFNWMMGRNLGTAKGKVPITGKITSYWPPEGSDPKLKPEE